MRCVPTHSPGRHTQNLLKVLIQAEKYGRAGSIASYSPAPVRQILGQHSEPTAGFDDLTSGNSGCNKNGLPFPDRLGSRRHRWRVFLLQVPRRWTADASATSGRQTAIVPSPHCVTGSSRTHSRSVCRNNVTDLTSTYPVVYRGYVGAIRNKKTFLIFKLAG
jgi:hypothetical protein